METQLQEKPKQLPQEIRDQLERLFPNFFKKVAEEPRGNIILFPDLNRLFSSLLATSPQTLEEAKKIKEELEMEKEVLKLVAVKLANIEEGGGVLSYLTNKEEPYRGVPHVQAVKALAGIKRIVPMFFKMLPFPLLVLYFGLLALCPPLLLSKIRKIIKLILDYSVNGLEPYQLQPQWYCQCVQETGKVITRMLEKHCPEDDEDRKFGIDLRDTLAVGIEFDNAYRFRYQDFWEIADMEKLAHGNIFVFIKEIRRIFNETIIRENIREEKIATTKKIRELATLWLLIDKKARKLFQEFCQEADIEKLRFTKEDRCFLLKRSDYMFEGKLTQKMKDIWQVWLKMYQDRKTATQNKNQIKNCDHQIKLLNKYIKLFQDVPVRT